MSEVRATKDMLSNGCPAYLHVLNREDASPAQPRSRYSFACGWCYLGAPHSEALHAFEASRYAA